MIGKQRHILLVGGIVVVILLVLLGALHNYGIKDEPAVKPAAATGALASVMGNTSELKQKPLRGYTIQLSAGSEVAALVRYAKQKSLSWRYWIYQTEYNGKPWYVLILGEYGSAKQAKAAINAMPAALRQSQPWPKSFGQVQKEMK